MAQSGWSFHVFDDDFAITILGVLTWYPSLHIPCRQAVRRYLSLMIVHPYSAFKSDPISHPWHVSTLCFLRIFAVPIIPFPLNFVPSSRNSVFVASMASQKSLNVASSERRLEAGSSEPGFASHFWHSEASSAFLQLLALTYHIPDSVIFKVFGPRDGAMNVDGLVARVALFPSMFSCGLRLPFPCLVCEILYCLGLAPT